MKIAPAEQGFGPNDERGPQTSWHRPARRREMPPGRRARPASQRPPTKLRREGYRKDVSG